MDPYISFYIEKLIKSYILKTNLLYKKIYE
jgi:hypothetical protein